MDKPIPSAYDLKITKCRFIQCPLNFFDPEKTKQITEIEGKRFKRERKEEEINDFSEFKMCSCVFKPYQNVRSYIEYDRKGYEFFCGNKRDVVDCYMYKEYKKELLEEIDKL